jgi:hypothetical protein
VTPEYLNAWQQAFSESGTVLVTIICRGHGRCGQVRASSLGPVLVIRRELPIPDQWIRDKLAVRSKGHDLGTVKPIVAEGGYLFDHQDRPASPTVACSVCGNYQIDAALLSRVVDEALRSGSRKHVVDSPYASV